MNPINTITDLANIIELSVAPVFLLAGIAGFLNVISGRLGRIVDRARVVEKRVNLLIAKEHVAASKTELIVLWNRVNLINWSIGLCTAAGLLVCTLIASLFIGGFWSLDIGGLIVGLFVLALLLLIFAQVLFIREVQLATRTMRIGREFPLDENK